MAGKKLEPGSDPENSRKIFLCMGFLRVHKPDQS
jgi:hypothetical protein